MDVGFILDSSANIENNYDMEIQLIKNLTRAFGIKKDGSHVAVIAFSTKAELGIKFNDHMDISSFDASLDKFSFFKGTTTRIDKALHLAQKQMFGNDINGARPGIRKLLILLTGGTQTQSGVAENPSVIAGELRKSGIDILAVAIGDGTDQTELNHIAGCSINTFASKSSDDMLGDNFIAKVTKRVSGIHGM